MSSGVTFKADDGTTYGFTDEDGKHVERRVTDGTLTARTPFEERLFEASFGLKRIDAEPKAKRATKRRSTRRRSSPKAAPVSEPATEQPTAAEPTAAEKE